MTILEELKSRFRPVLAELAPNADELADMLRPTDNPRHGDYQANFAMPLAKQLGRSPREIAAEVMQKVNLSDLAHEPEVAGPGFINVRLKDEWLAERLTQAGGDERLSIERVAKPRTFVVDFSGPNVAKPLHVGHLRSTVIGDAICRLLRFLGHQVVGDNHLGDWGTQFGMVIYGYKHFRNQAAYEQNQVIELGRLYREVRTLMDYQDARRTIDAVRQQVVEAERVLQQAEMATMPLNKDELRKVEKRHRSLTLKLDEAQETLKETEKKIAAVETSPALRQLAAEHPDIGQAVLRETAALHQGDPENRRLWGEFMPHCKQAIQSIYDQLDICFDYEYGESSYHEMLADVVESLRAKGLVQESDGAMCVFLEGFDAPMIVQKRDGAFLYATTDLATIKFRMEKFSPDAMLYVVDHRQSQHFALLFAAARKWGYADVELAHIAFGTVMGPDGKPYKTRAGDVVGLQGLLDDATEKAYETVVEVDEKKKGGPQLSEDERRALSPIVGLGALKYADLSQNRTSDYEFSYKKMLALDGNTAAYMQYAYARVQSIFAKGEVDPGSLRGGDVKLAITHPKERSLALMLLRADEALLSAAAEHLPNLITSYLYDLAKTYSEFYEACPVLKAETEELRRSRLLLCDLTARTIKLGLSLLGIGVADKM